MSEQVTPTLSTKQAGALRQIPGRPRTYRSRLDTSTKQAATRLIQKGLVRSAPGVPGGAFYRRTPDGDTALETFDETMRERYRELLTALWEGTAVSANDHGVQRLIEAGLAYQPADNTHRNCVELTDDGKSLAETAAADLALQFS